MEDYRRALTTKLEIGHRHNWHIPDVAGNHTRLGGLDTGLRLKAKDAKSTSRKLDTSKQTTTAWTA